MVPARKWPDRAVPDDTSRASKPSNRGNLRRRGGQLSPQTRARGIRRSEQATHPGESPVISPAGRPPGSSSSPLTGTISDCPPLMSGVHLTCPSSLTSTAAQWKKGHHHARHLAPAVAAHRWLVGHTEVLGAVELPHAILFVPEARPHESEDAGSSDAPNM
jgi:hypothetical protein